MNILFTICGRAGSKGVAGKNVRDFIDVPLAWLTLAAVELYKASPEGARHHIDTVVNTDSDLLIDKLTAVPGTGLEVIRRDPTLAGDRVRKVEVIRDCLTRQQQHRGVKYDMVVDLDITSPLRRVADIANAVNAKAGRDDTDVVFSAVPSRRLPDFNMFVKKGDFYSVAIASGFGSRQEAPDYYDINGSIYAYSPHALMHKDPVGFFYSRCDLIAMPDTAVLDIDSEEDYNLMQVIARHLYDTNPDYAAIHRRALSWLPATNSSQK